MNWFKHLLDIIYPRPCEACEEPLLGGETLICTACLISLPKTNSHLQEETIYRKRFWGKIPVANTFTYMSFSKKGKAQKLLHELKYKNKPELGIFLGELYGNDLKAADFNKEIDFIIAVPLHPEKQKQRGYNQAECLAQGLSKALNVPNISNSIKRSVNTATQTKKTRFERFKNVENIFEVINAEKIKGKRIAIVDDVLTTGATLESCGKTLLENGCKEISILTIASTY